MKDTTIMKFSIQNAKKCNRKHVNYTDVKKAVALVGGNVNVPAAYFTNNHAGYYPPGSPQLNTPANFITDSSGVLRMMDGTMFTGSNVYPWSPFMNGGSKPKIYKNITFTKSALNAINYFSK